jgi:hypothetical protein
MTTSTSFRSLRQAITSRRTRSRGASVSQQLRPSSDCIQYGRSSPACFTIANPVSARCWVDLQWSASGPSGRVTGHSAQGWIWWRGSFPRPQARVGGVCQPSGEETSESDFLELPALNCSLGTPYDFFGFHNIVEAGSGSNSRSAAAFLTAGLAASRSCLRATALDSA